MRRSATHFRADCVQAHFLFIDTSDQIVARLFNRKEAPYLLGATRCVGLLAPDYCSSNVLQSMFVVALNPNGAGRMLTSVEHRFIPSPRTSFDALGHKIAIAKFGLSVANQKNH